MDRSAERRCQRASPVEGMGDKVVWGRNVRVSALGTIVGIPKDIEDAENAPGEADSGG